MSDRDDDEPLVPEGWIGEGDALYADLEADPRTPEIDLWWRVYWWQKAIADGESEEIIAGTKQVMGITQADIDHLGPGKMREIRRKVREWAEQAQRRERQERLVRAIRAQTRRT